MDVQTLIPQKTPSATIIITGIALAMLIPLGLTIAIGDTSISYYDKVFYSRFFYWGTMLFLFFYAYKIEHQPLLIWKPAKFDAWIFIVSVIVLYLLFIGAAIVSAIPTFLGLHDNREVITKIIKVITGHPFLLFLISFTAGVTEEFIFRGYILTRLMQLFKKPLWPVLISSILFSALHYKYNSLHEYIFAFAIGVIFSIYYIKYRDIKPLIVTHFLIDFINLHLAEYLFKIRSHTK
ncbi:MAG TPA: type II CAAX endopeptidase family protein [Mucilaginibacter sp.]|nr:type II CAAX endopeptidase family protein [Mucilaginibacter sp.]